MKVTEWYNNHYRIKDWRFELTYGTENSSITTSMGMVDKEIIEYFARKKIKVELSINNKKHSLFRHSHWAEYNNSDCSDIHYICQTSNYLPPRNIKAALQIQPSIKLTACDHTAALLRARGIDCSVLHHGINLRYLRTPDRQQGPFTFLTVAGKTKFKGLDYGIQAFKQFNERYPDSRYIIVSKSKRLDTGRNIEVLSRLSQEQLFEIYSRCHVYLCTSLWESFCNPLFEAGCAGMYLISNDIPIVRSNFYKQRFSISVADSKQIESGDFLVNRHFAPADTNLYDSTDMPCFHIPEIDSLISHMEHSYLHYRDHPVQEYSWDDVLDEEGLDHLVTKTLLQSLATESYQFAFSKNSKNNDFYLNLIPHHAHSIRLCKYDEIYCLQSNNSDDGIQCNDTVAWIWQQINGQRSLRTIIDKAIDLFGRENEKQVQGDILSAVETLKAYKVIYLSQFDFTIALIAIGELYNSWALALIDSLRNAGDYDGLVHIITDDPNLYARSPRTVTIQAVGWQEPMGIKLYKTRLLDLIPGEHILYIDVDVICGGSLLSFRRRFNEDPCRDRPLQLFRDSGKSGARFHSGVMFINQDATEQLSRWRKAIRDNAAAGRFSDQEALGSVMNSDDVNLLPADYLVFPDTDYLQSQQKQLFIHFTFTFRQLELDKSLIRNYLINVLSINHIPVNLRSTEQIMTYREMNIHNRSQWLKIDAYKYYDGQNKIANKEIARKAGAQVPETYQIADSADQIDFDALPSRFVIKPSHLAGGNCVYLVSEGVDLLTGRQLNLEKISSDLDRSLLAQQRGPHRDFVAKFVKPRIIVEELLLDSSGAAAPVIEFHTIHGKVLMIRYRFVNEANEQIEQRYTRQWQLINFDFSKQFRPMMRLNNPIEKPEAMDEAINRAEKLAVESGLECIRVGQYITSKGIYFGEFTLVSGGGAGFTPWLDYYMGMLWKHPKVVNEIPFSPETITWQNKWKILNGMMNKIEDYENRKTLLADANDLSHSCLLPSG